MQKKPQLRTFFLNFGPQHPAAHGVLRLVLEVSGELIKGVMINIGLLHRGSEKLIESKTLLQGLPYFDRLDYVSVLAQEHVFCLAAEGNLKINISNRSSQIRIIGLELTRILNHLMGITTHALDVGAMTPFLWGFEEREKIMSLCEILSGSRVHMGYFRPGGVSKDIPNNFLKSCYQFICNFISRLNELEDLLAENRIWQGRLLGVGKVTLKKALQYSSTGPILRSSGGLWDLRKIYSYEVYPHKNFSVPLGITGDSYERFLLRVEEMRQSSFIIMQSLNAFSVVGSGSIIPLNNYYSKGDIGSMEYTIQKFKDYFLKPLPMSESYTAIEAPKGETGVYLSLDGSFLPYRCKVTSPAYKHLQMLPYMSEGSYLADLVTIIGTQDIVFGEVDR